MTASFVLPKAMTGKHRADQLTAHLLLVLFLGYILFQQLNGSKVRWTGLLIVLSGVALAGGKGEGLGRLIGSPSCRVSAPKSKPASRQQEERTHRPVGVFHGHFHLSPSGKVDGRSTLRWFLILVKARSARREPLEHRGTRELLERVFPHPAR